MIGKNINRRNRNKHLALITVFGMALIGCSPVYKANTLFMPQFEEQGDFIAEASVGSADFSVNAGYAFTEKFAFTAGFQTALLDENYEKGSFFAEGGLAWYKKQSDAVSYEILGGFGYGQTEIKKRNRVILGSGWRERLIESNFTRWYLQSNVHFNVNPFTFSLGSRFSHLYVLNYDEVLRNEETHAVVDSKNEKNFSHFYIEPNGTVTLNIGNVSLFTQFGFSFLTAGSPTIMDHDPFMLNVGFRIRLNSNKTR